MNRTPILSRRVHGTARERTRGPEMASYGQHVPEFQRRAVAQMAAMISERHAKTKEAQSAAVN